MLGMYTLLAVLVLVVESEVCGEGCEVTEVVLECWLVTLAQVIVGQVNF